MLFSPPLKPLIAPLSAQFWGKRAPAGSCWGQRCNLIIAEVTVELRFFSMLKAVPVRSSRLPAGAAAETTDPGAEGSAARREIAFLCGNSGKGQPTKPDAVSEVKTLPARPLGPSDCRASSARKQRLRTDPKVLIQ